MIITNKKYLLIGDHRTCENYGSIATCDQLIELMRPRRLSIIPITRMDQDYDYMPLEFSCVSGLLRAPLSGTVSELF